MSADKPAYIDAHLNISMSDQFDCNCCHPIVDYSKKPKKVKTKPTTQIIQDKEVSTHTESTHIIDEKQDIQ